MVKAFGSVLLFANGVYGASCVSRTRVNAEWTKDVYMPATIVRAGGVIYNVRWDHDTSLCSDLVIGDSKMESVRYSGIASRLCERDGNQLQRLDGSGENCSSEVDTQRSASFLGSPNKLAAIESAALVSSKAAVVLVGMFAALALAFWISSRGWTPSHWYGRSKIATTGQDTYEEYAAKKYHRNSYDMTPGPKNVLSANNARFSVAPKQSVFGADKTKRVAPAPLGELGDSTCGVETARTPVAKVIAGITFLTSPLGRRVKLPSPKKPAGIATQNKFNNLTSLERAAQRRAQIRQMSEPPAIRKSGSKERPERITFKDRSRISSKDRPIRIPSKVGRQASKERKTSETRLEDAPLRDDQPLGLGLQWATDKTVAWGGIGRAL